MPLNLKSGINEKREPEFRKIYFEITSYFLCAMVLLRLIAVFFGELENHFFLKMVISVLTVIIAISTEYFIGIKSTFEKVKKRYLITIVFWLAVTILTLTFEYSIPFLFLTAAVICFSCIFRNHQILFLNLVLCLVTVILTELRVFASEDITIYRVVFTATVSIMCDFAVYIFLMIHTGNEEFFSIELTKKFESQQVDISELNDEIIDIQETVILSVAEIIEAKSQQTGQHVKRVSEYVKLLCIELGYSKDETEKIRIASMLHDIGKLSVPVEIIEKKGRYTPEEYAIMKTHVTEGEKILSKTPGYTMGLARVIALQHHEKWDGSGYLGMKGEEIDKISRIVAVADVFDALVSSRSYKPSWTPDKAYKYITEASGKHFDPEVVEAFKKCFDKMVDTLHKFPENVFDK